MYLKSFSRIAAVTLIALVAMPFISNATERESGGRRTAMAIKVRFSSSGTGIDAKTQDRILALANEEIRSGQLVALTVRPWGREGERDLCLQFSDLQRVRAVATQVQNVLREGNAVPGVSRTSATLAQDCFGKAAQPNE